MYLRFATDLAFPDLARRISPRLTTDAIAWDYENIYEWMYVELPDLPFALNISRKHGFDDESTHAELGTGSKGQCTVRKPGHAYLVGWDRTADSYVDTLPDWLPQYLASALSVRVLVFSQRPDIDGVDPEPIAVINPVMQGN